MTDSNDEADRPDGEDDDGEQDTDLDELQPVSTSLRSAQHRGRETDASADAAEGDREDSKPSVGDTPEADPDGLDKPAPVTSVLRSAQSRAGDDDVNDGDMGASDADGRDDD